MSISISILVSILIAYTRDTRATRRGALVINKLLDKRGFRISPAVSHPMPLPPLESQLPRICTQRKGITSHYERRTLIIIIIMRVLRLPFPVGATQRRFGSPWVDPIKASWKRVNLSTVIPGAALTLSAFPGSLPLPVFGPLFLFP